MTELRIKLHQPLAEGYLEAGAVATVRLLADPGGKIAKQWWSREKPVAVAGGDGSSGSYTRFELPGGGYYGVDITRPRGSDLSREFLVREGEVRAETIRLEVSPHEYLGWQQYAGIVRSDPYRREAGLSPAAPPAPGMERLDILQAKGRSRIEALYSRAKTVPNVFAADLPASEAAWARVAEAAGGGIAGWARAGGPLNWAPQWDAEFAAWFRPMPGPGEGIELTERLRQQHPPNDPLDIEFPRWLSFEAQGQIDLASVPWAWWGAERHQGEEIRFLYDLVRPASASREATGHLTLTVQDRRWFGLLEFLGSGRMNRAGKMFHEVPELDYDPEAALSGKVKGPLVAVAGGIILIAHAETTREQRWDRWLENLNNWFPGIPDGPILLGCRRVEQATNLDELRAAYHHLRMGIERGIPFFSASIRMLAMALAQVGGDIPEADQTRRFIAPVSARVDPNQPFTVIRL